MQDCALVDAINGVAEVVLSSQAYVEIGTHSAELVITKDTLATVTRSFEYSSLNAILDEGTITSTNDWQALHDLLLSADTRPILGAGAPYGVVTPLYQGQMYLDTIGMMIYFAPTNDTWLPIFTDDDTNYVETTQGLALWTGTQAEYDAIGSKDASTLYFITG